MLAMIISYDCLTSIELLTQIVNSLSTNTVNFTKRFLTHSDFDTGRRSNAILVSNISVRASDPFAIDLYFLD